MFANLYSVLPTFVFNYAFLCIYPLFLRILLRRVFFSSSVTPLIIFKLFNRKHYH